MEQKTKETKQWYETWEKKCTLAAWKKPRILISLSARKSSDENSSIGLCGGSVRIQ